MLDLHADLYPYPSMPCSVLHAIKVGVRVDGQTLHLDYQLMGKGDALAVPDAQEPVRADNLWQKTCCEVFLKAAGQKGYFEVNLSPSTRWACYHFSSFREGMADATIGAAPVIKAVADAAGIRLQAAIDLSMLPSDFANSALTLALSCVVEGRDGSKSFWALNHPPEKPDFHHDDCFQLQIGAALRP